MNREQRRRADRIERQSIAKLRIKSRKAQINRMVVRIGRALNMNKWEKEDYRRDLNELHGRYFL